MLFSAAESVKIFIVFLMFYSSVFPYFWGIFPHERSTALESPGEISQSVNY